MKRIAFVILFLLSLLNIQADQIQDSFFGYTFGKTDFSSIKGDFSQRYTLGEEMPNLLCFLNVEFAKYQWKSVDFLFAGGLFFEIVFTNYFTDEESALAFNNRILSLLTERYKGKEGIVLANIIKNRIGFNEGYFSDGINVVIVGSRYRRSRDGKRRYSVELQYANLKLSEKNKSSQMDEL